MQAQGAKDRQHRQAFESVFALSRWRGDRSNMDLIINGNPAMMSTSKCACEEYWSVRFFGLMKDYNKEVGFKALISRNNGTFLCGSLVRVN